MSTETLTGIQGIFTTAATQMGGMMVPVLTAGVAIAIGILAFTIGKKLLKNLYLKERSLTHAYCFRRNPIHD